jgi:hypothetical protein
MHPPAEYRVYASVKCCMVYRSIGPAPEHLIGFLVQPDQLAPHDGWLSNADGERIGSHAVLHSQDAGLELFALRMMRVFRRVRRNSTGLHSEGEIGVARTIGGHHGRVAR